MFKLCFFKGSRAKSSPQEALPRYHSSQAPEKKNHSDTGYLDVLGQMDLLFSRDGSPLQSAEALPAFQSLPYFPGSCPSHLCTGWPYLLPGQADFFQLVEINYVG